MQTPITLQILFSLVFLVASVAGASSSATSSAAIPTSTAGLDPCIETCSSQAATAAGCGTFTNVTCVCTSQQFQTLAGACLQKNCTAADVQAALQLQSSICKGLAPSSGSGSATGSGSASSAPTSASGPGPVSVSSTGSGSAASGSATSPSGSSSGSASSGAATSSGAALGKLAGLQLGKELAALGVAVAGALLGGALVL